MIRLRQATAWCLAGIFLLAAAALAADFPNLTGRVVDNANLIGAQARQGLDAKLAAHEAKTTNQIVVVTLKSLQGLTIEQYGYQLGRAWGIGQEKKNNGVLLIVAPNERKVRIEVGYGLEGDLTDALASTIIQNDILPEFRAGGFESGILRGVDAILLVLDDPAAYQEKLKQKKSEDSIPLPNLIILLGMVFLIVFLLQQAGVTVGGVGRFGRGGSGSRGGGGFSGGGGSFGGGGSSGGW